MEPNYKITIISVSPLLTECFRNIMRKEGLDYPIYEANFEGAVEITKQHQNDGIPHVFITRGRTYTYLCEHTNATLVNVKSSYFSYIPLIKKYREQGIQKIAILGFSDQFEHIAEKLNHTWDEDIRFYSYPWREYTDKALQCMFQKELIRLKNEGFEAFIGSYSITKIARSLGLLCEENMPDSDMVEAALNEAQQIALSIFAREEKLQTISAFLQAVPELLLKIDQSGKIINFNLASERMFGADNLSGNIFSLFPDFSSDFLSGRDKVKKNAILTYGRRKIVAEITPIIVNEICSGAIVIARFVEEVQMLEQNIRSQLSLKGLIAKSNFGDIHGKSETIQQTIQWAKRIASADGTVLITGETGTGKELFAQSIHNYSARSKAPFVAINCASLSPSILESELFGYVKGAFTGASPSGKQGIFEVAHRGTIFLDEIGEIPVDIQSKLLRVIQEKEVVRIGDTKVIPIDVRIIAATNQDLEKCVRMNRFRADLFYRLNVLTLHLPTLAERKADIPGLACFFLTQEKNPHEFTEDALEYLKGFPWPGNVRQLKNHVERASVFIDHYWISLFDLQQVFSCAFQENKAKDPQKSEIEKALQDAGGNRARAAEALGISTVTLWRRMKKHRMIPERSE